MHSAHAVWMLAFATGCVLLSWVIVLPMLVGIGRTVWATVRWTTGAAGPARLVELPWLGIAAVIALLQLWNFELRIGGAAAVLLLGWGVVGLWVGRREWKPMLAAIPPTTFGLFALLAIWLADRSIGPMKAFDSGLYHLQVIRWANTYSIVTGLGNLHGRLAFNNAGLLLDALLNVGPWHGRVEHMCGGVLLLPLLWEASAALTSRGRPRPYRTAASLLIVPCVVMMTGRDFASPTSDFAPAVLALAVVLRAVDYAVEPDDTGRRGAAAVLVVLLAATAVTTKLSVIAFAGSTATLVGLHRLWLARRPREAVAAVIVAAALLVPWLLRGALLSGYPLYPSRAITLDASWRVPATLVDVERDGVRVWGRQYYQLPKPIGRPTGWPWLKAWASALPRMAAFDVCVPVAVTLAAAITIALRRRSDRTLLLVTVAPALIGIGFWFVTAPAPRFASSTFWAMAVGAAAAAGFAELCATILAGSLVLVVLLVVHRTFVSARTNAWNRVPAILVLPGPDHGFGVRPLPDVVDVTTRSGVVVHVPRVGDQTWDSPLPSAPYVRPGLRLREPGSIGSGFVLESPETITH